ncbi:uncharacterized protein ARMOST_15010 [Armillaria ostoyae]|uniref:Uncharacterized protein n=1 Tax=Armillaria ostoyae TaxID=47428 RepID=A0A284RS72_ARMOS|nr:uncharacterized protein ARMOST_15010 [Armillaria ostoyae]
MSEARKPKLEDIYPVTQAHDSPL